jgi:hypothetical protein
MSSGDAAPSGDPKGVVEEGEHLDCRTADEFLNLLSPQNDLWAPDPSVWIFRGHAVAEWQLVARAHRSEELFTGLGVDEELADHRNSMEINRRAAESALLRRFHEACDDAGLTIPAESPFVHRHGPPLLASGDIPSARIPLLALAQHYGLPTSLMDWTRHSGKAAYFAAADTGARQSSEDRLAVWALQTQLLDSLAVVGVSALTLVTAPRASNPNLHAQSGVFTKFSPGEFAVVDAFARHVFIHIPGLRERLPLPWLRKVTLPRSCTPRLLEILSYSGINGASMFPGYEGVVRRIREEAFWRSSPRK